MILVCLVEGGDGAEVALEVAATREFHQGDVLITFAQEDFAARPDAAQGPLCRSLVDRLQAAVPRVVEQLSPDRLCIADDDGVCLLPGFLRQEGDMVAAQNHVPAACPERAVV